MPPFDDQLVIDLLESVTLGTLGGGSSVIASCSVDEIGVQSVQAGVFSLVSRDYQITMGHTQCPTRPVEGAIVTLANGVTAAIVSVLSRVLGSYYEVIARSFTVPGGLPERGTLYRRNSTQVTTAGLSNPTFAAYQSNIACRLLPDAAALDTGDGFRDSLITGHAMCAGYREWRDGDRFTVTSAPSEYWDVAGSDPYDPTLGVQILRLTKRK